MTGDALSLSLTHVRTTERLTVLIEQATLMVAGMRAVHDSDDALAPELGVALVELNECVQALRRAHQFSQARLDVALGNE